MFCDFVRTNCSVILSSHEEHHDEREGTTASDDSDSSGGGEGGRRSGGGASGPIRQTRTTSETCVSARRPSRVGARQPWPKASARFGPWIANRVAALAE